MTNPFGSFDDIVSDPYFRQFVADEIEQIETKRKLRPLPKPGYKYRRDWYDKMADKGQITAQFFVDHIVLIWQKRSNLDSETRSIVKHFCDKAFASALNKYDEIQKAAEIPSEKPKAKPRKKKTVQHLSK